MTNIGELSVGIGLDYSELDKQIAGLGDRYKDIKFSSSFDGKGLEAEFKRYRDKFSRQSVTLGLHLDGSALESEFKRYQDKLSDQSISFNLRLDGRKLDDDFKRYRDKFSGQSVTLGVRIDAAQVAGVRSQLERQLSGISVTVRSASGSQSLPTPQGTPLSSSLKDIEKGITEAIGDGFKKVRSGNILGGIGSLIMAPLRGAMQGLFMGIGDPLGKQLGSGLSKGLNSALGESIGSFELLAERSTEKAVSKLGTLKTATVEAIQASNNTAVVVVRKQVEQLERVLQRFKVYNQLREQPLISRVVPKEEALRISASVRFDQQQQQKKEVSKAGAIVQDRIYGLIQQLDDVKKVEEQIARNKKVLEMSSKTLSSLRGNVEGGLATGEQIADYQAATEAVSQATEQLGAFEKDRSNFIKKLKEQAEALISLEVESDFATTIKQLIDLSKNLQDVSSAQVELAQSKKGVRTNANTPEAIRDKKLQVMEQRAATASGDVAVAQRKPWTSIQEVQKLEKVAASSQRALDLYRLELANPEKEIKAVAGKIQAANADLEKQLTAFGERLSESIPKAYKRANLNPVTVENIGAVSTSMDTALLNAEGRLLKREITRKSAQEKKDRAGELNLYRNPQEYVSVVNETYRRVTGGSLDPAKIPSFEVGDKAGPAGEYNFAENKTTLSPKFDEVLHKSPLTKENLAKFEEAIEYLTHETVHAIQADFGKYSPFKVGALPVELPAIPKEELDRLDIPSRVELSVNKDNREGFTDADISRLRDTEKQAYIAQYTIGKDIAKEQSRAKAVRQFEERFGFTGFKVQEKGKSQSGAIENIRQAAKEFKVDFSQELEPFIRLRAKLQSQAEELRGKSLRLQDMSSAQDVLALEEEFNTFFVKLDKEASELGDLSKQLTQKVIQSRKAAAAEVPSNLGNIEGRLESAIAQTDASISSTAAQEKEALSSTNAAARAEALRITAQQQNATRQKITVSAQSQDYEGIVPESYNAIASQVAAYSNLTEFKAPGVTIPKGELQKTFDKTGTIAAFLTDVNKIALKPELLQHMQSGQKLDYQAVGVSVHELRHAAQLGFGKLSQTDLNKGKFAVDMLVPTAQELAVFGQALEQSIAAAKIQSSDVPEDIIRAVEQDAYTFEMRYGQKIYDAIHGIGEAIEQQIDSIDVPELDDADFAQFLEEGFNEIEETVEDVFADFDARFAALETGIETVSAQVSQSTESAIASGEQKLEAGITEAAQAHQELIEKLADPGLTGDDIKEIAKLAEIPGRGAKGLKRKDREKLISESVIKGETSPDALAAIMKAVEVKRGRDRVYKDTAIPKPQTDWAKKVAGDLTQASVESIQDFGKRSQAVLNEAIAKAKTIADPSSRLEEFDRIRASIIEYQSAILEASGTQTDASAKKHLEMLKVRLQSDRKSLGLAMTATQSEVVQNIATGARSRASLSSGGMEQSIRQSPGALFSAGAFGGRQQPPSTADLEKEIEVNAKRAVQIEQELGKAMQRGLVARIKRFFGLAPQLSANEIAARAEESVKADIGGQADRAEEMNLIRTATEGIRRRIHAAKPGEGLKRATKVLERLARSEERQITQSVQQSTQVEIDAAVASTQKIDQEFQQQQQRVSHQEREALQEAIDERQSVRRREGKLFERLGLKHGLFNFQAPELEEQIPAEASGKPDKPQRRTKSGLSLFGRIAAPGVTRQTEILAMNAQSLLGDIEAQVSQANLAEKEAKLIERQIKTNEQRIEKLTRRQLTEGGRRQYGMGRLSDKQYAGIENERARLEQVVVEDKAKLGAGRKSRQERSELASTAKSTKSAIAEVGVLLGKESLSDKDLRRLGQLRTQLAQVFEQMQQPIPGNNFLAQFGITIPSVVEKLGGLLKGFLAFQGVSFVQNQLRAFSAEAFQAAIAASNLRTSLNFSEGGAAKGGQALGFVRKTVEDLRIPLQSSLEGYAKLSASTRGTAAQGKPTRALFTGVSEAATVLGLPKERIDNIYTALSQVAAKGVVSMEELRGQIGENLPGALTIAAQGMGMTQDQLMRLIETGQLASSDFLPRFAAALHANFGDAAKEASGNAQSALYNLQNSIQILKESFGEAIAPASAAGLNVMSGVFTTLGKHGGELATVITALSVALAVQLAMSVKATLGTGSALDIFFLGIRKAVAGTWAAIAPMMGQMLLIMGAVVVAIEGFKIASRYINGGELAQQFKQMEDAAARTAKGIGGVKEAILDLNNTEPPAQGWSDQAILNSRQVNREGIDSQFEKYGALGGAGSAIMKTPLGALGGKLAGSLGGIKTIAESDRDKAVASILQAGKDIEKAQADAVGRLTDPNYGKGAIGSSLLGSAERMMGRDPRTEVDALKDNLKGVDDQLQSVSQQRKTLQAEIARNYTNLGKAVPPELKEQLAGLSTQFQELSTQRTDIAKPYQDQLQNVQKAIEQTKTQLDFLSTPEGAAQFRGAKIDGKEVGLDELKKRLQENLDKSKNLKNTLETLVQSANADPVLTLTEAFRRLNLELNKLQEKSAFKAASDSLSVAQGQLAGFSKDPFYQGRGALEGAKKERDRINADNQGLAQNIAERQKILESGANQAIMQQLGVDENSSAAEIQNRIDTNKDMTDAEKGVLENLKKVQEDRLKLQQGLAQSAESELKVRQQIQQNTVDKITFEAGNRDAKIRQGENATQERIQQEQGKMGADRAVEELSKIPVQTTNKQIESAKTQLEAYKQAYKKGLIDRRTYLEKERDLTTQMSDLQRTKREQIEQQTTDTIARHAAIREATIRRDANAAMIAIRQDQKNLDPRTAIKQMEAQPLLQTDQSIQAAQAQLKEYRQAFEQGQINAKTYADKERELTTQVSDLRRQKVEQIEQQVTGIIARNTADRQALIKREETDAIASIRRRYLDRQITEKQATEEAAKISRDTTDRAINDIETQLSAYQKAYKDGSLNAKDYVDKERDLTTQLHDLKKQQIEQEIALRDAANARILEGIELANRLAEAQIQEFSDAQTQLIKQGQLAGRPEYVASRELEQTQAEVLRSQIEDTQRRMGETDDLYRQGVITDPKQYTEQRIQLEQQLAQQQIQLLDNQISQQKRLREEQSKAIDDRIRGQERSQELANAQIDIQAKGIELQVKEVELIQKADELSKQLLDSRHNLAKALGDADVGQTQIKLDAMTRGKDLMGKALGDDRFTLNTSDADIANLKAVIGSQLGELGVGIDFDSIRQLKRSAGMGNVGAQQQLNQYEIAILDARSRLEEEMAAKRLNALGLEQQFARENLEMELRRGELQARSALFASKQAEFQVQQSRLQLESQVKLAQLEEEKARLIEDPRDRVRAIADAQAKMELATGQLNLVPDQLTNAQGLSAIATENVSAQEELALNARRAMEATQSNERSQFVAAQNARKQAEQLERAEAAAKRTAAANAAGSGGLNFTNLNEQQKQQLDEAMKTMEIYSQPMPENRRKAGLVAAASGTDNPFLNLLLRQQGDKDIADIADKMKSNATPFSGMARSQLMMASQMGDKDVVGELQKLNENMSKMASEPRSISVSTATPMEDTMRIMSDINRPMR